MKHVCCYSGGHSSALAAIEVVRRFGRENVVLVNHDINFTVEHADIKRFKSEVADYLGMEVTQVDHPRVSSMDQFDVCVEAGAFKVGTGSELCTSRLKTEPFMKWLPEQGPATIYYGFDPGETARIQRRSSILGALGYASGYPVALWKDRTIHATEDIGIARPLTYGMFKHGNCVGCLKAGWQHWYVVFCTRQDIWLKAKWAEAEIGYAIHHDERGPLYLEDVEPIFASMQTAGVVPTEQVSSGRFWSDAKKKAGFIRINDLRAPTLPCECAT